MQIGKTTMNVDKKEKVIISEANYYIIKERESILDYCTRI